MAHEVTPLLRLRFLALITLRPALIASDAGAGRSRVVGEVPRFLLEAVTEANAPTLAPVAGLTLPGALPTTFPPAAASDPSSKAEEAGEAGQDGAGEGRESEFLAEHGPELEPDDGGAVIFGGTEPGGEHGNGVEGEHQHHKGNEAVTITAAASLLGMTAGIQVLFFLTNCRYMLVRIMTWRMVSAAISIFAAVLVFSVCSEILDLGGAQLELPCLRLVVAWVVSQATLYRVKEKPLAAVAVATLWGHTTGFFAIGDFGYIQEHHYHRTVGEASIAVVIAVAVIIALSSITRLLRKGAALADDGDVDEIELQWMEQCEDFEDDVISMSMGNLIAQVVRMAAVGHFVEDAYDPEDLKMSGIAMMWAWGLSFTVLLILCTWARHHLKHQTKRRTLLRTATVVQNICGMSAAWTILFALRWHYLQAWAESFQSYLPAILLLALCISVASILILVVLNIITNITKDFEPRSLRAVTAAVGLLVGLSWECTFHHAIEGLAESTTIGSPHGIKVCLSICLFILIFPSWEWYILPRTERRLHCHLPEVVDDSESDVARALEESVESEDEEEMMSKYSVVSTR